MTCMACEEETDWKLIDPIDSIVYYCWGTANIAIIGCPQDNDLFNNQHIRKIKRAFGLRIDDTIEVTIKKTTKRK